MKIFIAQPAEAELNCERHFPAGLSFTGDFPEFEVAKQFIGAQCANARIRIGSNVGGVPGSDYGPTEFLTVLLLHEEAARGVAFATMRRAIHQIFATVPLRRLRRIWRERL